MSMILTYVAAMSFGSALNHPHVFGMMYLLVFEKEELKLHMYIEVVCVISELYIVHCT